MKKIKIIAYCALIISVSAPSFAQTYSFKILDNLKISKSGTEDVLNNPFGDKLISPNDNIEPVPKCETNNPVGETDCFDRLYVDRQMLNQLIAGSVVYSNEGQPFDSYAHNKINTYHITDMSNLFYSKPIAFDIYEWDVKNVTNMYQMFRNSSFNQPIGNWNVSNVTTMRGMFYQAKSFNQPIGNWDIRNVNTIQDIFYGAGAFNQDLTNWDVCHSPTDRDFDYAARNWLYENRPHFDRKNCIRKNYEDLNFKDNKIVVDREILDLLINNPYNELVTLDGKRFPITYSHKDIDVSNITNMASLFYSKPVRFDIYEWDISSVVDMYQMFRNSDFNQPIGNWNVSNVTTMRGMFYQAKSFNQPIVNWDISNVNTIEDMFYGASVFNQDLTNWDICHSPTDRDFDYAARNWLYENRPYFDRRNCD